jgi:hypothetical protein
MRVADAAERRPAVDHPAVTLVPAGLALGIFVLWGHLGGGYDVTRWLPGALFLLGLLAATVVGLRRASLPGRLTLAALGLLGAFTAWSYLSIAWAELPADAWNGANRTLLYLVVFALFASLPWTLHTARLAIAGYALGVALVAAATLWKIADTSDPELFNGGRLMYPTGYVNSTAALFITGMFAALVVAPRRDAHPLLRSVLFGAATLLAGTALLSQSRAALVAVPLACVVAIAVVPGRVRTAAALAIPLGAVALGWDRLLDVYPAAEEGGARLEEAFAPAGRWILVTSLVAAAVGLAWALVDRRVELAPATARWLGRGAAIGAVVVLLVGGVVLEQSTDVRDRLSNGWDEFTSVAGPKTGTSNFSSGLGSNRWDFWTVGMNRFTERPLYGIGADNYAADYLRERRSTEEPRYPHSLEVRVLAQLGLVGAALLAGALLAAAAAALLGPRRREREIRALAAGALVVCAYWLAHGSVDWFWEIPGLAAPAIAFLGIAAAIGERRPPGLAQGKDIRPHPQRRALVIAGSAAAGLVAAAACASLVLPWLAARDVQRALSTWRADPAGAYALLDSARRLNALSERPDLYAGAIAARRGDLDRMRVSFERALERNPASWYAELELGLLDARGGAWTSAEARLERALSLNPREPVLRDVLARVRRHERVPFAEVDELFLLRAESRLA